jgi:hypothetical protein
LDKPRLGDLGNYILDEDFDDDLSHDETLCLWFIVLRRKTDFEDVVDYLAIVLKVDGGIRGKGDVRLEVVEEVGKGRGAARGIRGGDLGGCVAVVAEVLGEDGGRVMEEEGGKVEGQGAGLEDADDGGEYAGDLWEELLVIAGDLRPPGADVGTEGEGEEVVELGGELWGEIRGGEERGDVGRMVREEDAAGEGLVGAGGGAGEGRERAGSHRNAGRGQSAPVTWCGPFSQSSRSSSFSWHGPGAAHADHRRCRCGARRPPPSRHPLPHRHHPVPAFPRLSAAPHPASLPRAGSPARPVRGLARIQPSLPHPPPPPSPRLPVPRRQQDVVARELQEPSRELYHCHRGRRRRTVQLFSPRCVPHACFFLVRQLVLVSFAPPAILSARAR